MVDVRRSYLDGPDGQIHLRTAGLRSDRPPLLCFHMSPMSGRIYERFMAHMGEDRLVVAVDTPGFGMSDGPDRPPEIADYARAMEAVIDGLDLTGPVDLMGYHTGSMIASDLARSRPEQVRRLVLVSAPIFTEKELTEVRQTYGRTPPDADGEFLLTRWRGYLHYNLGRGLGIEDVADMFPDGLLGRGNAWWGHRAAFNHRADMGLPEVRQPVMVINPGDDLQENTRRAASLLRSGTIVERPEWGHGFLDASTEDAVTLVRAFLDDGIAAAG